MSINQLFNGISESVSPTFLFVLIPYLMLGFIIRGAWSHMSADQRGLWTLVFPLHALVCVMSVRILTTIGVVGGYAYCVWLAYSESAEESIPFLLCQALQTFFTWGMLLFFLLFILGGVKRAFDSIFIKENL